MKTCAHNILEREYFDALSDSIKDLTTGENGQVKPKKKTKRPSYYCGLEQAQLVRHLKRKHKTEEAVVAALVLPKAEQKQAFERIRKEGILKLNINNMEKGQSLVRERRQGISNDADVGMCNGCNRFFDKKSIYRHKKRCVGVSGTTHGSVNFATLKSAESLDVTEEFKAVLCSFRNDEAGKLCRSDPLIIMLGKKLWAKSCFSFRFLSLKYKQ